MINFKPKQRCIAKKAADFDLSERGIVCWILANICSGEPNSFCFILTDEALMNKIMIYAIEAEWKIKQHALTGIILDFISSQYLRSPCNSYFMSHAGFCEEFNF